MKNFLNPLPKAVRCSRSLLSPKKTKIIARPILVFLFVLFGFFLWGQVPATVLNGHDLGDFIPLHSEKTVVSKRLPPVDVEAALREDSINGIEIPRFGVKIPAYFSKDDGDVEEFGNKIIWKIAFLSEGAVSLNLQLNHLALPEGSRMYLYDKAGTMFIGPIENKHVYSQKYATDIIKGEEVVIEVIMPKSKFGEFTIEVTNVIHGFQKFGITSRDYDDSATCNVDVNCTAGAGWEDERDAVALIIVDGTRACSGSLINDACQDISSFFLTAFHCLDVDENGVLSSSEKDAVADWVFRFNYDSPDPTPPNCRGTEPTNWFTFSGADFRAAYAVSDFALLELYGSVANQPTLALAGWNRQDFTPDNGIGIHHPYGDVKKISFDNDALLITGWQNTTNTDHLEVDWEVGTTEPGSSGSPLFDNSHRIVGDLTGGTGVCINPLSYYGRFFTSWAGGGTDDERLSTWLGGNGNPNTTNTIRSPFITSLGSTSPGPVCTTNKTFTLQNPVPGQSVSWAVSPESLFATGGGASTSGTGTSAVLRAYSSSSSGVATLTFTFNAPSGCDPAIVSMSIWVGKPGILLYGDDYLCPRQIGLANLDYDGSVTSVSWSYDGPLATFTGYPTFAKYKAGSTTGYGTISASVTNACGTSVDNMPYQVVSCGEFSGGGEELLLVSPNPAFGTATVTLKNEDISNLPPPSVLILYDQLGKVVLHQAMSETQQTIDLSNLKPGVYFIEVTREGNRLREKIVVSH